MGIYRLKNTVQHYAWGSETFIPELLGDTPQEETPCAELWMGAHPRSPSRIILPGGDRSLVDLIRHDPEKMLGGHTNNTLPFLFKVLAAARPLSIQAHPNIVQAREGFLNESTSGILPDAFHRNYKDPNHKPELLCALTPFDAMSGFRDFKEIAELILYLGINRKMPEAANFQTSPDQNTLKIFFTKLLNLSGGDKSKFISYISEHVNRTERRSETEDLTFEWIARLLDSYPDDIGAISPLLLNTFRLQPGEAIYIHAGILHAYLKGAGIEIMANSDNVLRCGLTSKHIDLSELLKSLIFFGSPPDIIRPETINNIEFIYPTPAQEFRLSMIKLNNSKSFNPEGRTGAEIILSIEGKAQVLSGTGEIIMSINKGDSIFIPFSAGDYSIKGKATLYRAATP